MASKTSQQRSTGSTSIAESLTSTRPLELESVRLTLSAAGGTSEDFTVTLNSASGSEYDTVLLAQDMATVQDLFWSPEDQITITGNDVVDFAYANSNSRTYGLEIAYKKAGV